MVFQFLKDGQLFRAEAVNKLPGYDEQFHLPEKGSNVFLDGTLYTIEKSNFHRVKQKFGIATIVQIHLK
ncbi:hypothetical protein [Bacillus sp. CECT 9360]|uniref:hypothetical protein n=1 Tax=Bacillus sp. CECT 9360 TaxID=2845821 RepID=UPI001E60843F|nr:hypothetical protein [Bacillus sp. CECT 9360]CAH0346750.1 hypothetical protein BCI9360_03096 [Bacillus sp. CECT 9360]